MAGHTAGYEELFASGEVGNAFGGSRGVGPGPGGEFVDDVVTCEDELFGSHLAGCAESGGMGDGGPAVAEGVEGRVDDVHVCMVICEL